MTTHKELVERRFFIDHGMIHDRVTGRHVATDPEMPGLGGSMLDDALDLLNSLTDEVARLREALRPFADEAKRWNLSPECDRYSFAGTGLSRRDLRIARATLTKAEGAKG